MATKLFKECLLKLNVINLPLEESDRITSLFLKRTPITSWGKIDWSKIHQKIRIYSYHQIIPTLDKLLDSNVDRNVYIEWSEGDLPAIKTDLDSIIANFDDVISVAFDKFIFNLNFNYVIEIIANGQITIGLMNFNE